jgi:hypothetical protein
MLSFKLITVGLDYSSFARASAMRYRRESPSDKLRQEWHVGFLWEKAFKLGKKHIPLCGRSLTEFKM